MAGKPRKRGPKKGDVIYHPAKTFDDDLTSLATLFIQQKWSFTNVDNNQLKQDGADQRKERSDFDKIETEYHATSKDFAVNTASRHQRYSSALDAARGAFKHDSKNLARLKKFKRTFARAKKPGTSGGTK